MSYEEEDTWVQSRMPLSALPDTTENTLIRGGVAYY